MGWRHALEDTEHLSFRRRSLINSDQAVRTFHCIGHDALDTIEVEGAAGGGLVKVKASAKGRIIAVSIDESLLQPSEKQMVEDLVAAAFNAALRVAEATSEQKMAKITAGLPPGMKLPF